MKRFLGLLLITGGVLVMAQTPYSSSIAPADVAFEIPYNQGAAAVWQSLKKLHTRASLLMVTAHPDDEDGGMLTYESRGHGARVTLLTLNRGEGGANEMSPGYFDALGLVRTRELLNAGRYYGVDQYWTRVVDYGFSKTKDEALSHWTHDRVLADVVRVVRMTRPLVITSVFVGGPSDGHGNHQVAGAMAQEVFKAAGDPSMFPEQIRAGLRPWSPLKDYARAPFMRRGGGETLAVNVEIPEGDYDPMLGASYVQISRQGLGFQKSQNGGPSIPAAGKQPGGYHRYSSTVAAQEKEGSFFDGIDVSLMGIATLAKDSAAIAADLRKINTLVEEAIAQFQAAHPEKIAPQLADGLRQTEALIARVSAGSDGGKYDVLHELNIKKAQFNNALVEALGISVSATVAPENEPTGMMAIFRGQPDTFRAALPGQTFPVKVHVVNQSGEAVSLANCSLESLLGEQWTFDPQGACTGELTATDARFRVTVPQNARYTRPYFTRPNIEQSYYDILDERYLNLPLAPYPVAAWADFTYHGATLRAGQLVQSAGRQTGYGQVLEPLVVAPAISIAITPRAGVVPLLSKSFPVTATVHSNVKGEAKGTVKLELPEGWTAAPAVAQFTTPADGSEQSIDFMVKPAKLENKEYQCVAVATYGGKDYREGYEVAGYPGLRPYFLYRPANYKTSGVDVKVAAGLKVGYITGTGDEVPASLEHLGIKVTYISSADLATGDLSRFDVVLLGVRAYAAREELKTYNSRLLDYVNKGGVVIVQYNTPEFDHNYGPYPYSMTNNPEEVTDEESKIDILDPSNQIFTWPNKITGQDFKGWVEERGSKFMKSWDSHYTALLATNDPGQEPQKGGLLFARYGKGIYVYNAYAFYRELPEGVPGAYRIFANLLSLARKP